MSDSIRTQTEMRQRRGATGQEPVIDASNTIESIGAGRATALDRLGLAESGARDPRDAPPAARSRARELARFAIDGRGPTPQPGQPRTHTPKWNNPMSSLFRCLPSLKFAWKPPVRIVALSLVAIVVTNAGAFPAAAESRSLDTRPLFDSALYEPSYGAAASSTVMVVLGDAINQEELNARAREVLDWMIVTSGSQLRHHRLPNISISSAPLLGLADTAKALETLRVSAAAVGIDPGKARMSARYRCIGANLVISSAVDLNTRKGLSTLAHELWHHVQCVSRRFFYMAPEIREQEAYHWQARWLAEAS